jgi:hypothetical protein
VKEKMPPFIVLALPRSRTAWLAKYLNYGDWTCGHEEIRHLRSMDDARSWLSQDCVGAAETSGAAWWRLLLKYRPDARVLVVRRPVDECLESLMRLDLRGIGIFDRDQVLKSLKSLDANLNQVERRFQNVLSVRYDDLALEETCARVFEFCLPYRHDPDWFNLFSPLKIECNMPALLRHMRAFAPQMLALGATARREMLTDIMARRPLDIGGMTIQAEPFETFFRDGKELFAAHLVDVGEAPGNFSRKNLALMRKLEISGNLQVVTARSNGRMFGYLMTVISPSLESPDITTAIHTTFYASPDAPGLGLKLQRAALGYLRGRGVDEVFYRSGPRGSGPRMGALYRRLGAVDDGQMFRLSLKVA